MSNFDACFAYVAGVLEGGDAYTNDAADPGGETKWGISKRAFPSEDIPNLTEARARELYRRHYWQRVRGDDLPPALALCVFDCAVNQGTGIAARLLQRAVGATPDGVLGPDTMLAVARAGVLPAITALMQYRAQRYLSLDNATEERFERGWINRLFGVFAHSVPLLESPR